jgi:hypothetical protein
MVLGLKPFLEIILFSRLNGFRFKTILERKTILIQNGFRYLTNDFWFVKMILLFFGSDGE